MKLLSNFLGTLSLCLFTLSLQMCKKINTDDPVSIIPLAPTDLKGSLISNTQCDLSWTDNSTNEKGFKIERKEANGNYTLLATIEKDITTYSDKSVISTKNYYYRVYAYNTAGSSLTYTNEFNIFVYGLPAINTLSISDTTANNAFSGGDITSDGGSPILSKGIVWSTSPSPTTNLTTKTMEGVGTGTFRSEIKNLTANTTYYVRAYATNVAGTVYGNQLTFKTTNIDIKTGLIVYLPFTQNANDSSGNGYHGSLFENVPFVADKNGKPNAAIQLGTGYVTMSQNVFQFPFSSKFTMSFWFTKEIYTNSGRLVSNECPEGRFRIDSYAGGDYVIGFGGPYVVNTVTVDAWHHFVYVYDNTLVKLYIDGILVNTTTLTITPNEAYCAPFTLGAKASAPTASRWKGKMDQFRIYNRTLNESEVKYLTTNNL